MARFGRVRWEELFGDLEGQLAAEARAELEAEVADRTRREAARLRLVDRLRGAETTGRTLALALDVGATGAIIETGRVGSVGADWLLLVGPAGEVLVSLAAVDSVSGLGPEASEPGSEGRVVERLGLGHALRAVSRDRAEVRLATAAGGTHVGTIDRVGADHVELTEHPVGEPRDRKSNRRIVPFGALVSVRVAR